MLLEIMLSPNNLLVMYWIEMHEIYHVSDVHVSLMHQGDN